MTNSAERLYQRRWAPLRCSRFRVPHQYLMPRVCFREIRSQSYWYDIVVLTNDERDPRAIHTKDNVVGLCGQRCSFVEGRLMVVMNARPSSRPSLYDIGQRVYDFCLDPAPGRSTRNLMGDKQSCFSQRCHVDWAHH